jgi:nitrite reductase (NADH) large subunit
VAAGIARVAGFGGTVFAAPLPGQRFLSSDRATPENPDPVSLFAAAHEIGGKQKLVVVGNGMAGMRAVEELLKLAPDLYDITVFGAEPHPNYNRILLSPVLAGEMTINDIILNPLGWYADNGIRLHLGKTGDEDRPHKRAQGDRRDGTEVEYDRLLLATGSTPFMLPVPGNDLPGVISYRDIKRHRRDDRHRRHAQARGGDRRRPARPGSGQRPQAARHGCHRGASDALADGAPARQGGRRHAEASLEARGLKFLLEKQTEALLGGESGRVAAIRRLRFKDGLEIPADLVVMAAGIRPNTRWPNRRGCTAIAASW